MPITELKHKMSFPIIVLIFLALIWGSSFILMKKGLLAFSALQVGTLRIVFAWLVLLPIALKSYKIYFKKHWKNLLFLGMISNLLPAVLFATAETKLSSSLTGMLNALTPVFTIIIGVFFYSTKLNYKLVVGLLFGFAGSIVLSFIGGYGELGAFNFYALFVIAATVLYGISGNYIKDYVKQIDPLVLVSLATFMVGPIALIVLLSTDFISRVTTHPDALYSLGSIFILGAVGTAFALAIFNKLISNTSAVFASSVTYLIPIIAIAWGIIDGEALFPLHFLGIGLVIIGVFIINRFK